MFVNNMQAKMSGTPVDNGWSRGNGSVKWGRSCYVYRSGRFYTKAENHAMARVM